MTKKCTKMRYARTERAERAERAKPLFLLIVFWRSRSRRVASSRHRCPKPLPFLKLPNLLSKKRELKKKMFYGIVMNSKPMFGYLGISLPAMIFSALQHSVRSTGV